MKEQEQPKIEEWQPVTTFGEGMVYAKGNERKIVTEGYEDFYYKIEERKNENYRI